MRKRVVSRLLLKRENHKDERNRFIMKKVPKSQKRYDFGTTTIIKLINF